MRTRTIGLGLACAVLNGLAVWTAFHGPNWLTNTITALIAATVIGLAINLCLHKGDWRFRGPAFAVLAAYVGLMILEIWRFQNYAD
jgi:hypothetical protein